MKKILFTLLSAITLTLSSFANEVNVSSAIRFSFESTFAHAKEVKWSERNGYTVADFKLNDKVHTAYYEQNGELLVVAEQIMENELPKPLQKEITKKYADGLVTTAFVMLDKEGTKYFATIVKGNKEIFLKATGNSWEVLKVKTN